jgi:hypothetical protein
MSDSLAPNELDGERPRRGFAHLKPVKIALVAGLFSAFLAGNPAMAQIDGLFDGTTTPTPTVGATSPLGIGAGSPTGIPLGSTEIRSGGVSPGPTGLAGTITIPTTTNGTACSTVATSPLEMYGSPAMYDGGGTSVGATAPATAVDPGTLPISGVATPSTAGTSTSTSTGMSTSTGSPNTSGMLGMCGSGSSIASSSPTSTSPTVPGGAPRTGLPFGSYEIGNLGVSSTPAVPLPSTLPVAGIVGSGSLTPTMPTVSPTTGSTTMSPTSPTTTSTAACGTGQTQGLAARVPGAGNAGIRGTTAPEIMMRQFFLCERSQ